MRITLSNSKEKVRIKEVSEQAFIANNDENAVALRKGSYYMGKKNGKWVHVKYLRNFSVSTDSTEPGDKVFLIAGAK